MAFHLLNKKQKNHYQKRIVDEQLTETMKEVYHKYQLLQELENAAYDVSDDLYILRKIEGAKYLFLMREARCRNISGDISMPKKAKTFRVKKRGYQREHLFTQE